MTDGINDHSCAEKVDQSSDFKKKKSFIYHLIPAFLILIAIYPWLHAMITDFITPKEMLWRILLPPMLVIFFLFIVKHFRSNQKIVWGSGVMLYFFMLISMLDFFMFIIQGQTFNDSFFYHLSWFDVSLGISKYKEAASSSLSYLGITIFLITMTILLNRKKEKKAEPVRLLKVFTVPFSVVFVCLVCFTDNSWSSFTTKVYDIYVWMYIQKRDTVTTEKLDQYNIRYTVGGPLMVEKGANAKNLVLIFWESMSTAYLDEKLFPGLMPYTQKYLKEGTHFTNMNPSYKCTYSIAGVYSVLMGAPYFYNSDILVDAWMKEKRLAISDLMNKVNYYQVTMLGQSGAFAETILLYRYRSYDYSYAECSFTSAGYSEIDKGSFSYRDKVLYDFAAKQYEKLAASDKNFNLTLHTVDTHGYPGDASGEYEKYSKYPENTMLNAVHEADYRLFKFIERLKKSPAWKNTVVWVVADHLAITAARTLIPKDYDQKLICFALNVGQGEVNTYAQNVDLAPTILSSLNISSNYRFPLGQNLLGKSEPDPERFKATETRDGRKELQIFMVADIEMDDN